MGRWAPVVAFLLVVAASGAAAVADGLDGDGVPAVREVVLGTDPTRTDTDGDGLDDGLELVRGTPPDAGGSDADGDGLRNVDEQRHGTALGDADTDGDALDDRQELRLGTSPTRPDTDGDRLLDGWEHRGRTPGGVRLPGADPLRMDLYVRLRYGDPDRSFRDSFLRSLRAEWARMPVDNPDGSRGISLHVVDAEPLLDARIYRGPETLEYLRLRHRTSAGAAASVYHTVFLVEFVTDEDALGYGAVGGSVSVVRAGLAPATQRRVIVHELLHNVVGRLGAHCGHGHHVCPGGDRGFLHPDPGSSLSRTVADVIEERGFVNASESGPRPRPGS